MTSCNTAEQDLNFVHGPAVNLPATFAGLF